MCHATNSNGNECVVNCFFRDLIQWSIVVCNLTSSITSTISMLGTEDILKWQSQCDNENLESDGGGTGGGGGEGIVF